MFMRSEQLLDDAGVGEGNFVDRETLQNRELFNTYVQGIQADRTFPPPSTARSIASTGADSYITNTVQGSVPAWTRGAPPCATSSPKSKISRAWNPGALWALRM